MGDHAATDVIELPGRRGRLTVVDGAAEGTAGPGPKHARRDDEDSRTEREQRPGRHRAD